MVRTLPEICPPSVAFKTMCPPLTGREAPGAKETRRRTRVWTRATFAQSDCGRIEVPDILRGVSFSDFQVDGRRP